MICTRQSSSSKMTVPFWADSSRAGPAAGCGWAFWAACNAEPPIKVRASVANVHARFMVLLDSSWLLHVQGEVVDDEGGLLERILGADQVDANGLADVRRQVEGLLS